MSEREELLKNQEESARKSKYNETLKALENLRENESPVSGMSDEILRHIFSFLDTKEIGRCARVSSKWKLIAYERWEKLNLDEKRVPFNMIGRFLTCGTKYLSLQYARLMRSVVHRVLPKDNKLKYLNLHLNYDEFCGFHEVSSDDYLMKWELLGLLMIIVNRIFLITYLQS